MVIMRDGLNGGVSGLFLSSMSRRACIGGEKPKMTSFCLLTITRWLNYPDRRRAAYLIHLNSIWINCGVLRRKQNRCEIKWWQITPEANAVLVVQWECNYMDYFLSDYSINCSLDQLNNFEAHFCIDLFFRADQCGKSIYWFVTINY